MATMASTATTVDTVLEGQTPITERKTHRGYGAIAGFVVGAIAATAITVAVMADDDSTSSPQPAARSASEAVANDPLMVRFGPAAVAAQQAADVADDPLLVRFGPSATDAQQEADVADDPLIVRFGSP
jgi:hypothetical protein